MGGWLLVACRDSPSARMKLEFLPAGPPDCPLIRIFDFSVSEAQSLRQVCVDLAEGRADAVSLLDLPGTVAIGGCSLTLRASNIDYGCERSGPNAFECFLTRDSWEDVEGLIEPFCEPRDFAGFQWLTEHSEISPPFVNWAVVMNP